MVELWSSRRLQFEPKGWQLQMRQDLRSKIRSMVAGLGKGTFHAVYVSSDTELFDVENVLVYNVGVACFSHLNPTTVVVERLYASPPPCPGHASDRWSCYHAYQVCEGRVEWRAWAKALALARWENVQPGPLGSFAKPHSVWLAIKEGTGVDILNRATQGCRLGLEIRIHHPTTMNLIAATKPLVDGIFAGLVRSVTVEPEAVSRLAKSISRDYDHVEGLLTSPIRGVLTVDRLLGCRSNSIQWYPPDDLLQAFTLELVPGREPCSISGELFEVARHG